MVTLYEGPRAEQVYRSVENGVAMHYRLVELRGTFAAPDAPMWAVRCEETGRERVCSIDGWTLVHTPDEPHRRVP